MATLVLTAVGTVLGGPIGAAIGAVIGNVIDQQVLFAPKGRTGPRLNDLRLQTSTYGSMVPQIFGTMRVAGTVIWASDLVEQRNHQGGGKGRPSTTTYSYSASFAVAISSRPILRVGRIWADGNLLRGAAGDFKSGIGQFRLAHGNGDQAVDPLIGSAVGIGNASAHRGIAYALFEGLQLADFGNRIPSLTFEVVADEGAVSVGAIASGLSEGVFAADASAGSVDGYAASASSIGEALLPLVQGMGLAVRSDGAQLRLVKPGASEGTIDADMLARSANDKRAAVVNAVREPVSNVPLRLSLRYYDASRDFQAGMQSASRPGPGRRDSVIDLPATMTASAARGRAQERLQSLWTQRQRLELSCGWSALALASGMVVDVAGQQGHWRIENSNWEDMLVRLTLRRVASGSAITPPASAGAGVNQSDIAHGPTSFALIELPALTEEAATAPSVVVAAAGTMAGWRSAALFSEDAETATLVPMGATAPPATMGSVTSPPVDAGPHLFDLRSMLVVQLLRADMNLVNASDLQLAQGANLCLIGDELIQFGQATALGEGVFRLERLLRGRRGTEAATSGHIAGERFVMIERERLFAVPSEQAYVGGNLAVSAIGIGDVSAVRHEIIVSGRARLPLGAVHVRAAAIAGGWRLSWVRRSRVGWRWIDGVDTPLGEERELYRADWSDGAGVFRTAEVAVPSLDYTAAQIAADIIAGHGGAITIAIRQIGTFGAGPPVQVSMSI